MNTLIRARATQWLKRATSFVLSPSAPLRDTKRWVVLNYHSVHPSSRWATPPDEFARQLQILRESFEITTLGQMTRQAERGKLAPRRMAAITFDDGYHDNFEWAFPILRSEGCSATFFLVSNFLETGKRFDRPSSPYWMLRPMKWQEAGTMIRSGMSVGLHTHTHRMLSVLSNEEIADEIGRNRDLLHRRLGVRSDALAYPYGTPRAVTPRVVKVIRQEGVRVAATATWGENSHAWDRSRLRRIRVDSVDTITDFKNKISGRWDFVGSLQRLL